MATADGGGQYASDVAAGRIPTWSQLNVLGKSRLLRSSYLWFVFVPIAAGMVRSVNHWLTVASHAAWPVQPLTLPFSWRLLFLASVLFAVASLIYSTASPEIVRDYHTVSEFTADGKDATHIGRAFLHAVFATPDLRRSEADRRTEVLDFARLGTDVKITDVQSHQATKEGLARLFAQLAWDDKALPGLFWHAWRLANQSHPILRRAAGACYLLGFILLTVVAAQNVWSVLKTWP